MGTTRPIELRCGACYHRFFAPTAFGLVSDVRCPECRRHTSVGRDFKRKRSAQLALYSMAAISSALAASGLSYAYREKTAGTYVIFLGLLFGGLIMLIKSIGYYKMPITKIVIGGYEI